MLMIFPKDDIDQTLRIRRFLMAVYSYLMWMVLIGYCYYQGFFRMSLQGTVLCFSAVITMNIILYIIFRTGFNKHFKDPSLTMLQMLFGTCVAMLVTYYTDEVRGTLLLIYMVVYIFGVFRLQLRQFLVLSLYALAGYGYVILLLFANHPEKIDLNIEILYWIVLAVVLFWFSAIGSYINHLRSKLVKTNVKLKAANEIIKQAAILDDLTQAYNRRQMIKILQREKALADRGEPSFSLCILDLDDFKRVNDTFGHLKGDLVLKTLVQAIKNDVREQDYIARYGGEEFVVIFAYPELDDALTCAKRIKDLASNLTFKDLPEDFRITISVGVSKYHPVESIDALIGRADTALYRAKISGKNRIEHEAHKSEKGLAETSAV